LLRTAGRGFLREAMGAGGPRCTPSGPDSPSVAAAPTRCAQPAEPVDPRSAWAGVPPTRLAGGRADTRRV